jgi:hypothetical protein
VWRGIKRSDAWVAQLGGYATRRVAGLHAGVGGWLNWQFDRTAAGQLSDAAPGTRSVTEVNGWAEVSRELLHADLRLGVVRYWYPASGAGSARTAAFNTTELYARGHLVRAPLRPAATIWYDVDRLDGAFLEGSLVQAVPVVVAVANLDLGLSAGVNLGQHRDSTGNAAERGLAYLDFSASLSCGVGTFSCRVVLHHQRNLDPIPRRAGPFATWVSLGAGYRHRFGR